MVESGLVVGLKSGDWIVFHSAKATHFNLYFHGRRASLVMHTDKAMGGWVDGYNGWKNNTTLQ